MGGYAVSLVVDSFTEKATEPGAAAALAAFAGVVCAGLVLVARAVTRARRAARAPLVVWQILQAAVGKEALTASSWWGVALLALAVVALAGAFWPGVLREGASPG